MNHKQLRNRPFLLVEFRTMPKPDANTRVKGWMNDPANIVTTEHVSVVDRLDAKQMRANLILDLLDGKLIKNSREGEADEQMVIAHYVKKYEDMITTSLRTWASRQIGITDTVVD